MYEILDSISKFWLKFYRNHIMNKIYRKRQKFFLILKHMTFMKKIYRNIVELGLMIVIYV